jgi:hypothetical protein
MSGDVIGSCADLAACLLSPLAKINFVNWRKLGPHCGLEPMLSSRPPVALIILSLGAAKSASWVPPLRNGLLHHTYVGRGKEGQKAADIGLSTVFTDTKYFIELCKCRLTFLKIMLIYILYNNNIYIVNICIAVEMLSSV